MQRTNLTAIGSATAASATTGGGLGGVLTKAVEWPFKLAWHSITNFFSAILTGLERAPAWLFKVIIRNEITVAFQTSPWAHSLIGVMQGIAIGLLGLRIMWELWRFGVSRAEGEPVDLGRIGRGSLYALAGIFVGPWLALEALQFGNEVVQRLIAVVNIPSYNPITTLSGGVGVVGSGVAVIGGAVGLSGPLAWIVGIGIVFAIVILMLIIWMQSLIRAVEMVLAAIGAPLAAIGYVSSDEGAAAVWWRQTASLVVSQIVQVTMLYVSMMILSDAAYPPYLRAAGCIAALVVTLRSPHIVQQYAYHTGAGATTTQLASQAASVIGKSLLL